MLQPMTQMNSHSKEDIFGRYILQQINRMYN